MAIATTILTAFAYATTTTLHAMRIARLNQQAADLVTQQLEKMRDVPFGSLAHASGGVAGDPHVASCSGDPCYPSVPDDGEPQETLVLVAGGVLNPQISTVAVNNTTYTLYTYVTTPADNEVGEENRRVTVIAEWSAYGRTWSKTESSVVTQTQRGLPLPEFKLTPVGPSTVTVNPGVTAAFGFQLSNQGAPDQWNITADLPDYSIVLDDGDDVYNPATDTTPMSDHNGDGTVDSGRLEPKQSLVFWVLRPVPADAPNSTTDFGTTAQAVSQEGGGAATVQSTLVVTNAVITASPTPTTSPSASPTPTPSESPGTCAATNPQPTPSTVAGYNRKAYVLHNSGSTSWPSFPLPGSDPIPGSTAMAPMYLDMNGVSIPSDRDLPVYSTDLVPSGTPGRLLYPGGSFTSSASQVLDFRTQNPNRDYSGTMVLRLWVRPAVSGEPVSLAARVYKRKTNGNQATTALGTVATVSIDPFTCSGFQEVWFSFALGSWSTGNNTVLGVRLWNTGSGKVALAYDHGSFPATFTVVER